MSSELEFSPDRPITCLGTSKRIRYYQGMTPIIKITALQKMLDTRSRLDIESFVLQQREIIAVVGSVGSGKGELLSLLLGQSQPMAGEVRLCGLDPYHQQQRIKEQVGVLFREPGLYERLSARENLTFYCQIHGLPHSRADEVLSELGLDDYARTPVRKLSLNLTRRLAYGRAILHHPPALLLMDPFAGCDAISCDLLAESMREQAQNECGILLLTREGSGLASLCNAVYSLEDGHLSLVEIPRAEPFDGPSFKIPARQEGQVVLVNPADVLYAVAREDQTCLYTLQGQDISSHLTMSELEKRLARNGFFRAHRSYLVNLQRVRAVIPYTRDSYTLILDDDAKTEIPLSKSAARELRQMLDY